MHRPPVRGLRLMYAAPASSSSGRAGPLRKRHARARCANAGEQLRQPPTSPLLQHPLRYRQRTNRQLPPPRVRQHLRRPTQGPQHPSSPLHSTLRRRKPTPTQIHQKIKTAPRNNFPVCQVNRIQNPSATSAVASTDEPTTNSSSASVDKLSSRLGSREVPQ